MMAKAMLLVAMLGGVAAADPRVTSGPRGSNADNVSKPGVTERSRVEVKPANHAFKQLAIDNPLGDVRVEGYDGTAIMIETHKHAPDDDTLDRLRVSLVPNADGTVRITTTADGRKGEATQVSRSQVAIDLVIHAPRDARVDASVTSGKVEIVNMDAGGELDSGSGAISAKNVSGELLTHSVSGQTTIAQAFGSVDAATVSSDVDLDTITGEKLVASASKGRIAGRRVRSRDIELTTTDGKIVLEAEASLRGRMVVSSLRGDVDVRVRRHGSLAVRVRGAKLDLGAQPPQVIERHDGWSQMVIGRAGDDTAAQVDLQSRYGIVRFAVIE